MMKTYLIEHSPNLFVNGINRTYNAVRFSVSRENAKTFKTEKAANDWIKKYMNPGYLTSADTAKVVEA